MKKKKKTINIANEKRLIPIEDEHSALFVNKPCQSTTNQEIFRSELETKIDFFFVLLKAPTYLTREHSKISAFIEDGEANSRQ